MQVGVDEFEEFGGMKGLGKRADGAEFFRFVEDLRAAVSGNEKHGNLRLQVAKI
jgi:hypothetical protein